MSKKTEIDETKEIERELGMTEMVKLVERPCWFCGKKTTIVSEMFSRAMCEMCEGKCALVVLEEKRRTIY